MSIVLFKFASSFADERLSADKFADSFQELWMIERDEDLLSKDNKKISEALSSIFCLADLYNPNNDREDYEFSEDQLREQVIEKINEAI